MNKMIFKSGLVDYKIEPLALFNVYFHDYDKRIGYISLCDDHEVNFFLSSNNDFIIVALSIEEIDEIHKFMTDPDTKDALLMMEDVISRDTEE